MICVVVKANGVGLKNVDGLYYGVVGWTEITDTQSHSRLEVSDQGCLLDGGDVRGCLSLMGGHLISIVTRANCEEGEDDRFSMGFERYSGEL